MLLHSIANVILLIICVIAIAAAIYIKLHSNVYTRERYAFTALSSIVSLVILGVHSISTQPSWSALRSIWSSLFGANNIPKSDILWSEQLLIVILIMFSIYLINQSIYSWGGLISADQKRREDLHNDRPWIIDGIEEAGRLLRQAAPPPIYQRPDFSRSFAQIEPPKDTLAWHEIAKDLIVLRWNSHVFIDDEDYHPKAHTWIGRNKKTNLPAAVLCLRDPPSSAEIDSFIRYVSEVHKDRNIEMIAAIQYGIDNCLKRYDNTEINLKHKIHSLIIWLISRITMLR